MHPSRPALEPRPAVTGLLELFATRPLVALGEVHMLQDEADFINALLHHPAFPTTVRVIVVEFGNARHQAVVDRFVGGEPVAARDLRPVWRDFFGWGFDAPIYEQFFRTVRAINRTLPPGQRLRVLLGDPPTDWSQIRLTQETDFDTWIDQREAHYVSVVETNILAPGHHGLLIAGLGHFQRASPLAGGSTVQRLERIYPGSVHTVIPHVGFGANTSALEPYLAAWPIPSLLSLHTTWLGELEGAAYIGNFYPPAPDSQEPPEIPPVWRGRALSTFFDSYLYLGPRSSLTRSTANPAIYRGDEQFFSELHRRESSGIFRVEDLLTEADPRYFTD